MKIYYVSENCRVKGPAFLRLADNEYLEEGDVCIVNKDGKAVAYLLTSEQNSWEKCKFIDSAINGKVDWSNFLVYSYKGFEKRKGDKDALQKLATIFANSILRDLFKDLIEIVSYQKDLIDSSILRKIYEVAKSKPSLTSSLNKKQNSVSPKSAQKKCFISYLPVAEIDYVRSLIYKGKTEKDVIARLRTAYPDAFRSAFIQFNQTNPNSSIYDGLLEYFAEKKVSDIENSDSTDTNQKIKNDKGKYDYEEILQNLHINTNGKNISPHKPLLLLSIAELIEQNIILSPFIPLSEDLEKQFKINWTKYVGEGKGHSVNLHYPFFYMKSENFWTLAPKPDYEKKSSYSLASLRKNFYGAIIDKELFEALSNDSIRKSINKIIISKYLEYRKENNVPVKSECDSTTVFRPLSIPNTESSASPMAEGNKSSYTIVDYPTNSFAVYGDIELLNRLFKSNSRFSHLEGGYNNYLLEGPGWLFHKSEKEKVLNILSILREEEDRKSSNDLLHDNQQPPKVLEESANSKIPQIPNLDNLDNNGWINFLCSMKDNVNNDLYSPYHKTIFILSIIEGIKQGMIISEKIYPLVRMVEVYTKLWIKYVPKETSSAPNFYSTYVHFGADSFCNIERVTDKKDIVLDQKWNKHLVNKNIQYIQLHTKLYNLLLDSSFSKKLSHKLLGTLKEQIPIKTDDGYNTETESKINHTDNDDFSQLEEDLKIDYIFELSKKDFCVFLGLIKTSKGRPYPMSMISYYSTCMYNEYMIKKVSEYEVTGNIYNIQNINTLRMLLEDVRNDYGRTTTNATYLAAIELYIRFFELVSAQAKSKVVHIIKKNRKILKLPYGAKVKEIEGDGFILSGACSSTQLIKDFVIAVGVKRVFDLKIPYLNGYLVDKVRNTSYLSGCKFISGGYWLNTTGSLGKKVELIQLIADSLGIKLRIKIQK